jgi:hypothetical protein
MSLFHPLQFVCPSIDEAIAGTAERIRQIQHAIDFADGAQDTSPAFCAGKRSRWRLHLFHVCKWNGKSGPDSRVTTVWSNDADYPIGKVGC